MRPATDVAAPAPPTTTTRSLAPALHWIFRIAFFMEFVGHGAFGILGKSAWVPYFGAVGIGEGAAWKLMPLIGCVDILLGVITLLRPMRALLLYGAFWGLWTAMLRPLSGEAVWEMLERAGNYGIPLAFLVWSGWPRDAAGWLARIRSREHAPWNLHRVHAIVRVSLALLLIGHGGFGAFLKKPMLAEHWATVGLAGLPFGGAPIVPVAGWVDIALGLAVLLHPASWILVFVAVWKILTELLYPLAGAPVWEFIERGGSYAAPIALLVLRAMRRGPAPSSEVVSAPESAPA